MYGIFLLLSCMWTMQCMEVPLHTNTKQIHWIALLPLPIQNIILEYCIYNQNSQVSVKPTGCATTKLLASRFNSMLYIDSDALWMESKAEEKKALFKRRESNTFFNKCKNMWYEKIYRVESYIPQEAVALFALSPNQKHMVFNLVDHNNQHMDELLSIGYIANYFSTNQSSSKIHNVAALCKEPIIEYIVDWIVDNTEHVKVLKDEGAKNKIRNLMPSFHKEVIVSDIAIDNKGVQIAFEYIFNVFLINNKHGTCKSIHAFPINDTLPVFSIVKKLTFNHRGTGVLVLLAEKYLQYFPELQAIQYIPLVPDEPKTLEEFFIQNYICKEWPPMYAQEF